MARIRGLWRRSGARVVCGAIALAGAGCEWHAPAIPPTGQGRPARDASESVYHFAHLQTGARKLRGGSFPGEILVYPLSLPGVRTPPGVENLRVGHVRLPPSLLGSTRSDGVEKAPGNNNGEPPLLRAFAIDDTPTSSGPIRFWIDAHGDSDLTDDAVSMDVMPRTFATSNAPIAKILGRFGTGTLRLGPVRHAFVSGRPPGTDNFYLFISGEPWRKDHPDEFAWEGAVGLFFEAPPLVKELPPGVSRERSLCGVLGVGPRENRGRYLSVIDLAPEDGPRVFVDLNADGRLDEAPIRLARASTPIGDGSQPAPLRWSGTATIEVVYPSADGQALTLPLDVSLDLRTRTRPGGIHEEVDVSLTYRGEWGRRGKIRVGGQEHDALLFDELAGGDYRGSLGGNDSGVRLLIDLNDNGRFERDEAFDPAKEFAVEGHACRVESLEASGASFRLVEAATPTKAGTP